MPKTRFGFSLLELMVVLFIIGMITVMVMPTFRKTSAIEPKEFVAKLNVIMQAAWQQALSSGHTQKVLFDFAAKKISLFEVTHLGVDEDHDKETPVTGSVLDTQATIPDTYKIDNFYIKKKDIIVFKPKHGFTSLHQDWLKQLL